jgi:hypothetical protein
LKTAFDIWADGLINETEQHQERPGSGAQKADERMDTEEGEPDHEV